MSKKNRDILFSFDCNYGISKIGDSSEKWVFKHIKYISKILYLKL